MEQQNEIIMWKFVANKLTFSQSNLIIFLNETDLIIASITFRCIGGLRNGVNNFYFTII